MCSINQASELFPKRMKRLGRANAFLAEPLRQELEMVLAPVMMVDNVRLWAAGGFDHKAA
jgi:hypothetical protein